MLNLVVRHLVTRVLPVTSYLFIFVLVVSCLAPVPFALWRDSGVAFAAFGDIEDEVDSYEWAASDVFGIGGVVHVSGDIYAWAWDEYSSNSGYVSTISITDGGELGATIETLEISSYCSGVRNLVNLPGTEVFVVSYYVPYVSTMGRVATVTIDSSGDISAVIDTGEVSASPGPIVHVGGNFFALSASSGIVSFRVEDDGQILSYFGSWTGSTVKSGDLQYVSVDYTSTGNVGVAFYDSNGDDLWYGYHNGASWSFSQVITSGDVGKYCCLRFDSSNNPGISYLDSSNRDLEYAYHNGASWSTTVVDSADYCGYYSSMAFDSGDNPGISYYDATNHHIQYAYNGGSWSTSVVEDMGSNNGTWSVIGFDSDDDPHIVYRDETNDDVRYAYYDGSWTATGLVTTDNVGSYLGMAMDSGGDAHVVYSAYPDDVYRYITGAESSWSSPEDLLGELNGRVEVRMLGTNPVVAYRTESGSTDVMRVAFRDEGVWAYAEDLDTPAVASYRFGLATKSGEVSVAYVDTSTDLAYASIVVEGTSSVVDVEVFDAAATSVFGLISEVGSTDCFTFVYQDSSDAFVQTFMVSTLTGAVTIGTSADIGDSWNRTSVEYLWSNTIMAVAGEDYGYTMDLFTYSVNTSTGVLTLEDSCAVTDGVDRNTYGMDIVAVGDGDDGALLFWRDQSYEGNLYPVVVDGTEIEASPGGKWEFTDSCADFCVVTVERDSGVLGVFYSEDSGGGRSGWVITIDVNSAHLGDPSELLTGGQSGDLYAFLDTTPTFSALYNGGESSKGEVVYPGDNGCIYAGGTSYSWAQGRGMPGDGSRLASKSYETAYVGQKYDSSYRVYRGALVFDTSILPETCTITAASLFLRGYPSGDKSDTDFGITIVYGNPMGDTLSKYDYCYLLEYTESGGSLSTSSWADSDYNEIALNSVGMGWIRTHTYTTFGLRSSRDISATAPSGLEYVEWYTSFLGSATSPKLSITYEYGGTHYQVQLDDNSDFSSPYWDTYQVALDAFLGQGERFPDIAYDGPELEWHTPYYWRIRHWGPSGVSDWVE